MSKAATLVILARDPAAAKTRLASILDRESRSALAAAMLGDVLAATREGGFARRLVATESDAVRAIARRAGAETMDVPASGTNEAAATALAAIAADGSTSALVLAADLPLVAPADIEALLAASARAGVVIAPDRHRRGTNALFLAPPLAIAPAFGPDSFRAHRDRARDARLFAAVVTTRGLATDVDDANDLRLVLRDAALGPRTGEVLGSLYIPA